MKAEELIDKLNWRYAVKGFDASRKLTSDQLDALSKAVQLAPTCFGLQPFKVLLVSDSAVREKLRAAAYGQPQITDASEIFIFATYNEYTLAHVDEYATNIAKTRGITKADIQGFVDSLNGAVSSKSIDDLKVWNSKQAYIAMGFLLETAAVLDIDACPMEGFDPAQFDDILGLKEKNLTSLAVVAVGYRSDSDKYQELKKVRKSLDDLIIKI